MLKTLIAALCLMLSATSVLAEDIVLKGQVTGADHHTYKEVPFDVPEGVTRITVSFAYTGREQRTTIDLGLRDPKGFRGWSGGNKSSFTVSTSDATPSYLYGPLPAGRWTLLLGVPNIRKDSVSDYEAHVTFGRAGDPLPVSAFADKPLRAEKGWYRGDLHSHSGHSDASCPSLSGATRVPCPVFLTLETARRNGLDFIALTDHNTTSHFAEMRALQPYFDTLLLIPGREVTTFYGHANLFGPTDFIDFELSGPRLPDMKTLGARVKAAHGLLSINHPGLPTGELCMGCGWNPEPADFSGVTAIEVLNGKTTDGPLTGIAFWEARLNEGLRLTAIAGSDNHDPTDDGRKQSPLGMPATVIEADNLSQAALLEGIRKGRVFIDLGGPEGQRRLDLTAISGNFSAKMGGEVAVPRGGRVSIRAGVEGAKGGTVEVIVNGRLQGQPLPVSEDRAELSFDVTPDTSGLPMGRQWVRVNVRAQNGALLMLSNPIYLENKK